MTTKCAKFTSPCFGIAKTSLSLRKERDVAERQGEVLTNGTRNTRIEIDRRGY